MMAEPVHYHFRAMGGPCDLHLYGDKIAIDEAIRCAQAEVARLEAKYSRFRPDSELSQINHRAGQLQTLDPETAGLLDFADQCYRQSQGLFDITTGVLRAVWSFGEARLPEPQALEASMARVGWQRIHWQSPQLRLPEGMELDLGGLVKEFAADRVLVLLQEQGVHGLINLAGDIRVTGPQPDGKPWRVGIRHPRQPGRVAAWLPLVEGGLATSGDYERFFIHDGKRYCHLLSPKTGYPPETGPASVSVVAEHCLLAGALSTIAMLMGKEAESWLVSLGVPFLLFDESLTVRGTFADGVDREVI
ncbi:MAG: FAD:protein FMN transferase [Saccharospirillum sp.]